MSEKFSLRWNDFQSTVSTSFDILRQEKDFFDVTLVSDDETQIQAHKLVLSACSDFFKSILRKNSHSHPLLYLSGINSTCLSLILDYIYQGEVQIHQEHLNSFLEVAQRLKIEGLIKTAEHSTTSDVSHEERELENIPDESAAKDFKAVSSHRKVVSAVRRKSVGCISEKALVVSVSDDSGVDQAIQEQLGRADGIYHCRVCNYARKSKSDVKKHIETHIDGLSYSCSDCAKTFRSRDSLRNHKYLFH